MKKSREGNWDNHQDLSLFFSAAVFSSVCMDPIETKNMEKTHISREDCIHLAINTMKPLGCQETVRLMPDPKIDPLSPFFLRACH